ncbi:MAG: magnesium transporter CorA family protein [Candidatus Portnoybacteria bacterium]|nr:magnesium transporter CorA family protein [Candidatus Portnoybacteria bacterium]MDD4983062.1 magnesium transporter CorA family protein [Candidatus Portnoybacteria bacterium]
MKITHNQVSWQHIAKPNFSDLEFLKNEFRVSSPVLNELLGDNKRPKIEEYDQYLFIVLHFPVFNESTRQTTPTELDFIVTKDSVFTVAQNPNLALEKLFADAQNDAESREDNFKNSGWLLFYLLDEMVDSCLPMLDHIHEKIEEIEKEVFEGKEREMLKEVAIVKRDIIDFRRTIKPQRSILETLAKKSSRFFKNDLDIVCQEVIGSEVRVWNTLENHKEMIEAIEQTNSNLLSYQINQVMHTLTFFSIVLFSLTFIAGFFSMRALEGAGAVGIKGILAIMLATILLIVIIFKKKRWL